MFRKLYLGFAFVSLTLVTSCSRPAEGPTASATPSPLDAAPKTSINFVTARIIKADVAAGGSSEATVNVEVQSGYHINANPATDPYLKATEVELQSAEGLSVGYIKYPNALTKKFGFSPDKELAVYEGEVPIKVMLKADKGATKGPHKLAAKLRVQACDDQVCYAPGTLELSIPVVVN